MQPVEIKILAVDRPTDYSAPVTHFAIDAPCKGKSPDGHNIKIVGWVLVQEGFNVLNIVTQEEGRLIKRAPVKVPRPDVIRKYGKPHNDTNRVGFHFEISTLGLSSEFTIEIFATVSSAGSEERKHVLLGTIKAQKKFSLKFQPKFAPLLVTAVGRSGTTLLMQILGNHPEILITNFYPYELRQAVYWTHFLKTMAAPADFEYSAHPDTFFENRHHVGHNPYSHPQFVHQYKNPEQIRNHYNNATFYALSRFAVERIDEYYQTISDEDKKPQAKYFAEKFPPGDLANLCSDLYESPKEIILTRDFRDMLCSAKSFNSKRKSTGFGRQYANNDFEWVDHVTKNRAERLAEAMRNRRHTALHVKYEDLITNPTPEIERIFSYLRLDSSQILTSQIVKTVFQEKTNLSTHSTTKSPKESIGRWKSDMPPELQEYCRSKLGDSLKTFGYEID